MAFAKRFFDWLGGGLGGIAYTGAGLPMHNLSFTSSSGVAITEETALTIPAFFHGLRLYGQTIGSLDWNLIQLQDSGRSVARSHPVHRLIHDDPNEFQLSCGWRETMVAWSIAYGNSFSYIVRNGNMRPTALIPLLPDRTTATRKNGVLQYVTQINGKDHVLQPYEVFHLCGFSFNGLTGVPLVRIMKDVLGLSKAEEEFANLWFRNGCNAGGVVKVPGQLSDASKKNLKQSMQETNGGLQNVFKILFLEAGLDYEPFTVDADKSQMLQSRTFQIGEIARVIGLPPHLLYDLSRSTNNNIEQQGIEAVNYSFKIWTNKLCGEARRKLLYQSEQDEFEIDIDLKPIQQGDALSQANRDQILFNCCSITPNEIRAKNGMNPIAGGNQLFINSAIIPLDLMVKRILAGIHQMPDKSVIVTEAQLALPAPAEGVDTAPPITNDDPTPQGDALTYDGPPAPDDLVQDANQLVTPPYRTLLAPVVEDVVGRIVRREAKALGSSLARYAADPEKLAEYIQAERQHVSEALKPISEAIRSAGGKCDAEELADAYATATLEDLQKLVALPAEQHEQEIELLQEHWRSRLNTMTLNEEQHV